MLRRIWRGTRCKSRIVGQYEIYSREVEPNMTKPRADRIRYLRVDCQKTYKEVSVALYEEWKVDARWPKEGAQEAGEALCVSAARLLGEVPYKAPWA